MHTLAENNVQFEFLSPQIVKVFLGTSGLLSTPLIRELSVYSKVKHGSYAKAYLVDIENTNDSDESLWRVCKKAERFAEDVLVAVVYPHNALQAHLQNFRALLKPTGRIQAFNTTEAALIWIEHNLYERDQKNLPYNVNLITEQSA